MGKARIGQEQPKERSHDIDRYPSAKKAITRVLNEAELPERPIERLEFTFLASGEATYRVWEARAEESEGGYLPPETA